MTKKRQVICYELKNFVERRRPSTIIFLPQISKEYRVKIQGSGGRRWLWESDRSKRKNICLECMKIYSILQIENTNSMTEDQANTQISMGTTENAQSQKGQARPVAKNYFVSIVLILLGFYFLVFAIIELVTNYYQHSYSINFTCTDYQCTTQLSSISFPSTGNIYIYISNRQLTQNILEGFTEDYSQKLTNCNYYRTNSELDKNISTTNSALVGDKEAFPCGQIAMFYPQNTFTITNLDNGSLLNVKTDELFSSNFSFKNFDLAKQWADVQVSRYSVWNQNNVAIGLNKYWGYVSEQIPKNLQIKLSAKNKLKNKFKQGLKLTISDNLALSGYNIPLCAINFLWAVAVFVLGCVSFWIIGKNRSENLSPQAIRGETEQQNQCNQIIDSSPTGHC